MMLPDGLILEQYNIWCIILNILIIKKNCYVHIVKIWTTFALLQVLSQIYEQFANNLFE